jgi:hypothetical protein
LAELFYSFLEKDLLSFIPGFLGSWELLAVVIFGGFDYYRYTA